MAEPKIPEAKDDDPEDVSDKLSIAAAMWARGDRADAVSWLRRAAESASDLELDLRALELAKTASELTALIGPSIPAPAAPPPAPPMTAAPAAPPTTAAPVAAPPTTAAPGAAPPTTAAPRAPGPPTPPPKTAPKPPSTRPPSSRPPGGKLPPLPPLRPLGSAPTQQPKAPAPRLPSMVSSVSGTASASGTVERDLELTPIPPNEALTKPMPWDDAETRQIAIPPKVDLTHDLDATAVREAINPELLSAMKRGGSASDGAIRAAAVVSPEPPKVAEAPVPQASEPPPTRLPYSAGEEGRSTLEPPYLPLAVGLRVRLLVEAGGVRVVPDDGSVDSGTTAILVPAHADDDLRVLFGRKR